MKEETTPTAGLQVIYIDKPKSYPGKGVYSHMVGSTIIELHEFAAKAGIKRCHFSNRKGKGQPHYDVRKVDFDKCIGLGAVLTSRKFIVQFLKQNYTTPTLFIKLKS